MNKTATALLFILLLLTPRPGRAGTGDIWLQLSVRQSFFSGTLWDYIPSNQKERTQNGGTGLHFRGAIEIFQGITFGLSFEYLPLAEVNVMTGAFTIPITAQAMPLLFSYRQYSGPIYILAEAGVCFWNGDKGGLDKAVAVGGGYTRPLTHWLNLEFSVRLLAVFSDTLITPVTLSAGVSFVL